MSTPVPLKTEFLVNSTTANAQNESSIAVLADGGYVITWTSNWQDGDSYGIFAQRYDLYDNPVGSEFQVNTYTTGIQSESHVTALDDGGYVVVWTSRDQDGSSDGIYAQRYDAANATVGSEFRVNTTTADAQFRPTVTNLDDGGFLVVWQSQNQDGSSAGIYAQRYDAAGSQVLGENPGGGLSNEFRVNATTFGNQSNPDVTKLADGRLLVVWDSSQAGGSYEIYAQLYDADGSRSGTEFRVNSTISATQQFATATGLADGSFVITWTSYAQDGSLNGVYGQRYDATGATAGTEFRINTHTADSQDEQVITALADGGFVVIWTSELQDGSGDGVYGQRFDASGNAVGTEFLVNTFTSLSQNSPSVAATPDGGFIVSWASAEQDGSQYGVYSQRFTSQDTAFTIFAAAGGHADWEPLTGDTVDPLTAPTSTTVEWPNVDGTITMFIGTGFTFDPGKGTPTGGTVLSIQHLTSDGLTLLGEGQGLNHDLVTLHGLLTSAASDAIDAFYAAVFSGNDVIFSDDPDNTDLGSHDGADTIFSGPGNDVIHGGLGDDTIDGRGGGDTIDGGAGTDTVSYAGSSAAVNVQLQYNVFSGGDAAGDTLTTVENLTGSAFNDVLIGNPSSNVLQGGIGDDTLKGLNGADELYGGKGDDWLYVDNLDTAIDGGEGLDRLSVANGNGVTVDVAAAGIEIATGNTGADVFDGATSTADLTLHGRAGDDVLTGGSGDDYIYGDGGADQLFGGDGLDRLYVDVDDTAIDAGANTADRLLVQDSRGVSIDMAAAHAEVAYGNAGGDTFDGSGSTDALSLYGRNGQDTLLGGSGNDRLYGDNNDTAAGDIINGGEGNDYLRGGTNTAGWAERDQFMFDVDWGNDRIFDFADNGAEKIDFNTVAGITQRSDLTITDGAGFALISYHDAVGGWDASIRVDGVTAADLQDNDFIFV